MLLRPMCASDMMCGMLVTCVWEEVRIVPAGMLPTVDNTCPVVLGNAPAINGLNVSCPGTKCAGDVAKMGLIVGTVVTVETVGGAKVVMTEGKGFLTEFK